MAESPSSLRSIFLAAKSKEAELLLIESSSTAYEDILHEAISRYEECRRLIESLAIFSPNESSEDLATSAIQYLGVDYLLAELLLKTYGSDRQKLLQQASGLLDGFLSRLDSYELLTKPNRALWDQYQGDRGGFQLASMTDPAERRRVKVARFGMEKSLKTKLEMLRTKAEKDLTDDETARSLYFTELELFASQTFQSLDTIVQENRILSQARSSPKALKPISDPRESKQGDSNGYSERLDKPNSDAYRAGPLLSKEGKPLQPFTITDKRSQLRQGVFRPGHNLPTMSIDEFLEEEKRRGGIIDGGGRSQIPAAEPDEDDVDQADQAIIKARAWDEYIEANPRGSGNTMNRG